MTLERLLADLDIIQALDDEPNDTGGLSAAELKAKFDQAGGIIKAFLNESLLPTLESQVATKEDIIDITLGQVPDGSITAVKLSDSLDFGLFKEDMI